MEEVLIFIFLLLGPILDVFAFYNLPINIIVRGLYLLSIIYLIIRKKRNLKLLFTLLVFGVVTTLFQKFSLNFSYSESLSNTFKFLYLPISIIYFKNFEFKKYKKENILSIIIFLYIFIYLFSYVTKIGSSAYVVTDGKTGFKGLFTSINEFSAILVGLLPIVSSYLKNNKKYILLIVLFLSIILCSLLIGTKILLFGILVSIIYLLFQERNRLFFNRDNKEKIIIIISSIILISLGIVLFTQTRIYKNMVIQQSFFKADNFYDFLNHVIFNDRLSFLNNNFNYFKGCSIIKYLLGIGINDYTVKLVEIDIFDVLFRFGIIGLLLFIFSLLKINFKNLNSYEKVSLILLIFISLTSGHVLIYPNVCIYIALLNSKNKEERL